MITTGFPSCRGRSRTSTGQLAIAQSSVVDPGREDITTFPALCYVCSVTPTPETRGHVCQKFHHPTVYKNVDSAILNKIPNTLKIF